MDKTNKQPSMEESMDAMSGVQLHRYNAASIDLIKTALNRWTDDLSTPENPLKLYFIEVSFAEVKDSPMRKFFNAVPTSFFLEDEQIDKLIEAGRQLLRNNSEFQRFLADIKNS
jgi:NTE family protein